MTRRTRLRSPPNMLMLATSIPAVVPEKRTMHCWRNRCWFHSPDNLGNGQDPHRSDRPPADGVYNNVAWSFKAWHVLQTNCNANPPWLHQPQFPRTLSTTKYRQDHHELQRAQSPASIWDCHCRCRFIQSISWPAYTPNKICTCKLTSSLNTLASCCCITMALNGIYTTTSRYSIPLCYIHLFPSS